MQVGHFKRNTLRGGVFPGPWNVGDVVGVSTGGAVTIVSFGGAGSTVSLVCVAAEVLIGAPSFILPLRLVGGIRSCGGERLQRY